MKKVKEEHTNLTVCVIQAFLSIPIGHSLEPIQTA